MFLELSPQFVVRHTTLNLVFCVAETLIILPIYLPEQKYPFTKHRSSDKYIKPSLLYYKYLIDWSFCIYVIHKNKIPQNAWNHWNYMSNKLIAVDFCLQILKQGNRYRKKHWTMKKNQNPGVSTACSFSIICCVPWYLLLSSIMLAYYVMFHSQSEPPCLQGVEVEQVYGWLCLKTT